MINETTKKRILVVDDEPDILSVVKIILENSGYEVVVVMSGEEAVKKVAGSGFSLIILDLMMPGMTGWDLFTRLMEDNPAQNVIFMSVVSVTVERLEELREAGIKDYIKKPFDKDELLISVGKVLNV